MPAALATLANLKPNLDWATLSLFERTGWQRMAFGDFADNIGDRAEPKDAQEEIYVGLEHLDPQCLHIRHWGKGSDVTGTKLRFRKGDIIFGRRRAYQRKLAVAEFDGICSAHAMVVRAKPEKVLPEFLPFLMMSDRFMNRAVEISVGSLSPTINWTTLKMEAFDLPPLQQQRRVAEVLWAIDQALEASRSLSVALVEYLQSKIVELMQKHVFASSGGHLIGTLGDLFDERRETGFGNLPILAVTIAGKVLPRELLERSVIDKTGTEKYIRVCPNDIAYNTMRMWQGSCGVVGQEGIISPAYTVLVPRPGKADPVFWNYAFHTSELLDWFRRFSTGVASDRWRLYYRSFAKIPVRIPSMSLQVKSTEEFIRLEKAIAVAESGTANSLNLLKSAVNSFW